MTTSWMLNRVRQNESRSTLSLPSPGTFPINGLQRKILHVDPVEWHSKEDYQQALATVYAMKVVNDHAERGVVQLQEYCGLATRDETQIQYIL